MNTERTLRRSMYLMVAWSTMMLAMADGNMFPTALTIPVLLFAIAFERRDKHCPTWLAGLLGIGAFAMAIVEVATGNIESRLLSIAHVIVYLTWVCLFQKKTHRLYWMLSALSLLQIAVGAVLTSEGWYGALLLVALVLMLWTLAVFSLCIARRDYADLKMVSDTSVSKKVSRFRRPSMTSGGRQIDPGHRWVGRRFGWTIFRILCATAMISGAVFALTPRIWIGKPLAEVAIKAGFDESMSITGFTEGVRLGEMGTLLENSQTVLQIRLFDNDTGERVSMAEFQTRFGIDEPVFRGSVMRDYENGAWKQAPPRGFQRIPFVIDSEQGGTIRQEITLEPTGTRMLFALRPFSAISVDGERDQSVTDLVTLTVRHPDESSRSRSTYTVLTPKASSSAYDLWSMITNPRWLEWASNQFKGWPQELTRLKALAETVSGVNEGNDPDTRTQADRIQEYLSDSRRFTYSLSGIRDDESMDPVEDFLLNHRTGNCEYFASAMTLMMRSLGHAARVVSGFKGGYSNDIDDSFVVQHLHAHTWVEVYIDKRWQTFDPTPEGRTASVASMAPDFKGLTDLKMWLDSLWSRFVVNMSLDQQKTRLYEPLKEQFQAFRDAISGGEGNPDAPSLMSAEVWLSFPGLLICGLVLGALFLIVRFGLLKRLTGWSFGARSGPMLSAEQRVIAFYEQFREICGQHGLIRSPAQTELEFAVEISDRVRCPEVRRAPRWLAEQFYRARFGDCALETLDLGEIDTRLQDLSADLNGTVAASS